jgi:hypothetical protein
LLTIVPEQIAQSDAAIAASRSFDAIVYFLRAILVYCPPLMIGFPAPVLQAAGVLARNVPGHSRANLPNVREGGDCDSGFVCTGARISRTSSIGY